MKRLLPHFVYWTLILGLGIFLWQRFQCENQRIELLNQPTDEAIFSLQQMNRFLENSIKREAKEYPNERNSEFKRQIRVADSLIAASFKNAGDWDSLPARLGALTGKNPHNAPVFSNLLPPRSQPLNFLTYQAILTQNDSLRRQLAYAALLDYFGNQMGRLDLRFDAYQPVASFTNICPRVGEPFEMDVLLCRYYTFQDLADINVNGQDLPLKEGLTLFEQTFPRPGVYPLQVKIECQPYWENDSVVSTEKTFYLHINR